MADCARYEPTIEEIMADPVVKALMRADRVNPDRLQNKLRNVRHMIDVAARRGAAAERPDVDVRPYKGPDAASRQFWG